MTGRLLGVDEVAEYLGMNVRQIREMVYKRQIPVTRINRRVFFDTRGIDRWLEQNTEEPERW